MKYCPYCGKEIDEKAVICVHCGCAVSNQATTTENPEDTNHILFGLLGAFIPIAGLVLFVVWKNTYPKRAKAAGLGALIGWVGGMILGGILGAAIGFISYNLY